MHLSGLSHGLTRSFSEYQGILDRLSAVSTAAYSVRRLRTYYVGAALNVRRDSDNATQDIGFLLGGDLDVASLLSFVGTANGFVTTWYDQSNNANHATQTTLASQPQIVNGGTARLLNARPCTYYSGAQNLSVPPAALVLGATPQSYNAVARLDGTTDYVYPSVFEYGTPTLTEWRLLALNPTSPGFFSALMASYGNDSVSTNITTPTGILTGVVYSAYPFANIYYNGTVGATLPTAAFNTVNNTNGVIGGAGGTTANSWIGGISEVIVLGSAVDTVDRQTLESSQAAYYGITIA